jgi:CBS domain containing-hemolysin-like protein
VTRSDVALNILAVILVIAAAIFSAAEAAFGRISRSALEGLQSSARRGVSRLSRVLADPARYLNLLLLLRVAAELGATVVVATVCVRSLGVTWHAGLLAAGVMTVVSYVVIGVAPRTLGRQHAIRVALATAGVTLALTRVLGPVPKLLILIGNALTPGKGFRDGPFSSEAELRELVDLAEERKVIEAGERRMVHSVLELGDTLVREVMVPRTDIVFIEKTKALGQALSLALRSGFSRIPVVGEDEDDVVGMVYLKDLARRVYDDARAADSQAVAQIMRPATYVPDTKPVDELLAEMQAARTHVAVVIDEYGGTAGLVTIEDILEEIVGEIADEYDVEEPLVEQVDEQTARVSVRMPVEDIEEIYGVSLASEEVETVGGLLARELGRVPIPGSTVTLAGLTFVAERTRGRRNRVGTVLIRREPSVQEGTPDGNAEPAKSGAANARS